MTDNQTTTIPHLRCKTPGDCRKVQVCMDAWHCSAEAEIERLRSELEAAKADIAMLIQKEMEAANAES